MKRNLNQNQYQMSDGEREALWQTIRRETHGTTERNTPRKVPRPALALTAIAATLTLMVVWHLGSRQALQHPAGDELQVASVELEPAVTVPASSGAGALLSEEKPDPARQAEVGAAVRGTQDAEAVQGNEYVVDVKSAKTFPEDESVGSVAASTASPTTDRKHVIASVDDALSKQAGVAKGGEPFVRGGRSGNVAMDVDRVAAINQPGARLAVPKPAEPRFGTGSVTGGTTPPNGEQVELMYFQSAGVNPFVATEDDSLSTFALDVDNASWTVARSYLDRGMLPPRDAIRVEEFVNAFDAGWPRHTDQPFRIHTDGARSRFGKGYHLLRIGLVGREVADGARKPANLVFVIDISGSMARESRLGTVKKALHILLGELREGDRVGLVVYGSHGEVRLPLTDITQREQIAAAIDGLRTNGSTNAAEGLELAYRMARESYDAGIINRLVLCSDGVANTGASTEAGGILDIVRKASDEGITLSTIGFGMGNYNDVLMEKLANQGDGNYFYVDKMAEAERVFRENLTGLLQTIAREVKVQVEFEKTFVQRWRLLGYENRDIADKDFRNDQVDAGEVGAGHQVTALYELKLTRPAGREADAGRDEPLPAPAFRVGTIRLRHEAPAHDTEHAGQVTEIEQVILLSQFEGDYAAGTPRMRVQTVVAEFAELLRASFWSKGHSLAGLVPVADALADELRDDEQVQELARMIRQAADLEAAGQ